MNLPPLTPHADNDASQDYERGWRNAYRFILQECLQMLGYDSTESQRAAWIIERERAINELRNVCADFGDNDWPDSLDLSDIIDKHLARHLYQVAKE